MPTTSVLWNDMSVDLLKELWKVGLSASQIAAKIQGATRSAIIGKVHRLGLTPRGNCMSRVARRPKAVKPSEPKLSVPLKPIEDDYVHLSPIMKRVRSRERTIEADKLPLEPPPQPRGDRPGLMQLGQYDCKWPMGDPRHPEFHYCGARMKGEGPYCAGHTAIAYARPEPINKRKAA